MGCALEYKNNLLDDRQRQIVRRSCCEAHDGNGQALSGIVVINAVQGFSQQKNLTAVNGTAGPFIEIERNRLAADKVRSAISQGQFTNCDLCCI